MGKNTAMPPASKVYTGKKGGRFRLSANGKKVYLKKPARMRAPVRRGKGVVRGRGGYWQDFKGWSSANLKPFERGAGAVGKALFGDAGGEVGSKIGSWLGKITGLGDYKVAKNTLLGVTTGGTNGGPPRIENIGGRTVINHREYIADVFSSTDFTLKSYKINPGIAQTFPWLSDLAHCYQEWRPLGIIVAFESTSSNALNSVDTALGTVIIATNYNSSEPNYGTEREMLNTEFHTATKPSKHMLHPLECDPKKNPLGVFYIRNDPVSTTDNSSLWYDLGNVQVATVGMQANDANIGKLYISYEIELMKTSLNGLSSGKPLRLAKYNLTAGVTGAAPLGTTQEVVEDNIGLEFKDGYQIALPADLPNANFLGMINYYGSATANCQMAAISAATASMVPYFNGNTLSQSPQPGTVLNTEQFCTQFSFTTDVLGIGGFINFATSSNVLPGGAISPGSELIITQIHPPEVAEVKDGKGTHAVMDPYEERLRTFLKNPDYKDLPVEARLTIFDRLEAKRLEAEVERGFTKLTLRKTPEEAEKKDDGYVDLSASQLIEAAVKKVAAKK